MLATEINPLTLPSLPLADRHQLPNCPGIYFCLSAGGQILYIGQTFCLYDRWVRGSHSKLYMLKKLGFARLAWLALSIKDDCLLVRRKKLLDIERLFIRHFRPALNWDLPKSGETKALPFETLRKIEQVLGVDFGVKFDA